MRNISILQREVPHLNYQDPKTGSAPPPPIYFLGVTLLSPLCLGVESEDKDSNHP